MPPGSLYRADNVTINAGVAVSRPGVQGVWTAKKGSALCEILPYVKSDGTTQILTVQGGTLWQSGKTSTAPSAVPGSFPTIVDAKARMARLGQYAYVVDGTNGLIRTNLSTGGAIVPLNDPTTVPTAALTSQLIDAFSSYTSWSADSLSPGGTTNQVLNGNFASGTSHTDSFGRLDVRTNWTGHGTSSDWVSNPSGYPSGVYLICDTPGDYITSDPIVNYSQALDSSRGATQFKVQYDYYNADNSGKASVITQVIAYASTDGTGPVLGQTQAEAFLPNNGKQLATIRQTLSLPGLASKIGSYTVQLVNGAANPLGDASPHVTNVVSYPTTAPLTFTNGTGGVRTTYSRGTLDGQANVLTGVHIRHAFPSAVTLSNEVALTIAPSTPVTGLSFYLRLQQSGSTANPFYDTNPVAIDSTGTTATVDVSTVPSAVRLSCGVMEIVFTADVTTASTFSIQFGPLTSAGNLTVGLPYAWYVTEINQDGDTTVTRVIETNPAPGTPTLTPTVSQAEASIGLSALIAAKNSATTDLGIYRRGGSFPDDIGRKVAVVHIADNTITHTPDPSLVSWNHTTGVFIDNVPDSDLNSVDMLIEGRAQPPAGATAICAWQNRIWLAVGSSIYGSWLTAANQEDALYFTVANIANDPNNAIKGFYANAGQTDNDPIQALIPFGTTLVVLKQRSVWLLDGFSADNFTLQSHLLGSGVGCVAPRAACVVLNHIWFLGADGVYQFDADVVDPQSVKIEKSLLPRNTDGTPAISPTALAGCAMFQHNRRMLLLAPASGGSANSVAWVWDSRDGGVWTRWTGVPATSGASLTSGTDSNDVYLGGVDGQLYTLAGHADIDHAGATPVAIAAGITTNGFGQGDEGVGYWQTSQADRMLVEVNAPSGTVFSLSASGNTVAQANGAASFTQNWTLLTGGLQSIRVKVPSRVRGDVIFGSVDWSSTAEVKAHAIALGISEGAIKT